ncbi:MAG: hypothetical protein JW384_03468 [Nitrosomonadaceae bacterium]|nr:hypothetical protein [Nitrosomonadaceae bacterium]
MGSHTSLQPTHFNYPALYSYILLGLYGLYFMAGHFFGAFQSVADFGMLYVSSPGFFNLIGRLATATFGILTLVLVYFWGKKAFNALTGLTASLLLSFSALHIAHSHWALPDIPMTFFVALSLFFLGSFLDTKQSRQALYAGICAGIATSLKYNAALLIVPMLVAYLLVWTSDRSVSPSRLIRSAALSYGAMVFAFLLGSPYWLLDFSSYYSTFVWQSANQRLGNVTNVSTPWVWVPEGMITTEMVLGIVMVAGVLYAFIRPTKHDWLLLSYTLFYLVYVGSWAKAGMGYLLPVWPVLALFAGRLIAQLSSRFADKSQAFALIAALLLVSPQIIQTGITDYRMSNRDTLLIAKDWIEDNIEPGAAIAISGYTYTPPLVAYGGDINSTGVTTYDNPDFRLKFDKFLAQSKTYKLYDLLLKTQSVSQPTNDPYVDSVYARRFKSVAQLKSEGMQYIMVTSYEYNLYLATKPPPSGHPLRAAYDEGRNYYADLLVSAQLAPVREFTPTSQNLGPVIKIYRVL